MSPVLWIIIALAALIVGFVSGILYRKKVGEREIESAEEEAKRIINESIKSAESKKKEALLEAKLIELADIVYILAVKHRYAYVRGKADVLSTEQEQPDQGMC